MLENDPKQTIDEFECSSILKVSQESFISKRDQAELMLQLVQSHRQGDKEPGERGKKTLKLSSKKIKHIFPLDFFE